jgi:NitT/TauT family transport system ATP-binding protein
MIEFKKVSFAYDQLTVLEDFSDTFTDHQINCIIGPSGAGKTTILHLIASLREMQQGQILDRPKRVSYVFQQTRLIPQKTVFANLDYVLKTIYPDKKIRHNKISEYLKIVELETKETNYPHELSGGEQQRLSLIRSWAYPAQVMLFDEPFKSLDLQLKQNLIRYFLKLWETDQRTVIFVTHEIDDALLIGDNIHLYSHRPLHLLQRFDLDPSWVRQKLYLPPLLELKKQILLEIEKW